MSAPHPQSRIDDLTQRNRTLSHTIQRLKMEISNEEGRRKTIINDLHSQWQVEKDSWGEMQNCYRIHQLRLVAQMEGLKVTIHKEKEGGRRERVEKGVKEAEMLLTRHREAELRWRVKELELELVNVKSKTEEEWEEITAQYQVALTRLRKRCEELANETNERVAELGTVQQERDDYESQLASLKSRHSTLSTNSTTTNTQLERVTLQLEAAQTTIADHQRQINELDRTNASLKRQLEKWQNLDSKEEAQSSEERKRRVELEVQVKELERRLAEKDKLDKTLEKEKRKFIKVTDEWHEELARAQTKVESAEAEAEHAKTQQAKLEKQIDKLTAQLEDERTRVTARRKKLGKQPENASESEREDDQVHDSPPPTQPSKPKLKRAANSRRPESRARANKADIVDESDVELVEERSAKGKDKQVAESPQGTEDSEVEVVEKAGRRKVEKKTARKGRDCEGTKEVQKEQRLAKPPSRATSEVADGSKGKRSRAPIRPETQDEDKGDDEDDKQPEKKKKRKINPFPPSQPPDLQWGQLALGDGKLDIPTVLSPVKESEVGISGDTTGLFGRVGSVFGGFAKKRPN